MSIFITRMIIMMNYIFAGIILVSVICGIISGNGEALGNGVINGAQESVQLLITMAGMLLLWSGIMEIARRGGMTRLLGRALSPALRLLFRKIPRDSEALDSISMNVSANLLGLGNAATPFGLRAMAELNELGGHSKSATDDMITFVVMNTASIQIMPTMVATLRGQYGSTEPFSILPCVWISSAAALTVGLVLAKVLRG